MLVVFSRDKAKEARMLGSYRNWARDSEVDLGMPFEADPEEFLRGSSLAFTATRPSDGKDFYFDKAAFIPVSVKVDLERFM